jgi:hypothetical protein
MTPSEILRKAKALIDTPEKWTKGSNARSMGGFKVSAYDESACKFCSIGALSKANNGDKRYSDIYYYLDAAMVTRVSAFNDTHTHAEVMAKWDEAIALAEADERGGV